MSIKKIYLPLLLSLILISCSGNNPSNKTVIAGISSDIESLNPAYSFSYSETVITDILFLGLVTQEWDENNGELIFKPELAESWKWSKDSSSIEVKLKQGLKWSDGKPIIIDDIIFSFDIYSDGEVQSVFYGTFENFITDNTNHIIIDKTFEKIDNNTLKINFKANSNPTLLNIDMPILPKHIYGSLNRKEFSIKEKEIKPVVSGAFKFENRERDQFIRLARNENSILYKDGNIAELIFKIVPDYSSRLMQLKSGELTIIEDIKPDDVKSIENDIDIKLIKGKEYDFIGLSNIDQEEYLKSGKISPHKLFGSSSVRKAISLAINREEIISNFLYGYGEAAYGPVSPIFKKTIIPNTGKDFNPEKAKELLKNEGWIDNNKDGILEKEGIEFKFTLYFPTGNPRREFASKLIQNYLNVIGIKISLEGLEPNSFFDKRDGKQLDAWMAGWGIPIPLELKMLYYSDLKKYQFNFSNYQNKEVDALLNNAASTKGSKDEIYKKIQMIFLDEVPQIYLYWIDNITGHSKFLKGVNASPLGIMSNCSKWTID